MLIGIIIHSLLNYLIPIEYKKVLTIYGCIIWTGAKVLCKDGILTVGKNTVIAANAVLTQSTGDNEIWAGIPDKKCVI